MPHIIRNNDINGLWLFKIIKRRVIREREAMILKLASQYRQQKVEVFKTLPTLNLSKRELKFFNTKRWNKNVAKAVRKPIFDSAKDGFTAGINEEKGGYMYFSQKQDSSIVFVEDDPLISAWLDTYTLTFSSLINEGLQKDLNKIVKNAIDIGGSVEEIRRTIQTSFNNRYTWLTGTTDNIRLTAWQARRIPQTETTTAQNAGHLSGLDKSGVVTFKAWLSSRNSKVRETHNHTTGADSKYTRNTGIPLKENFKVGEAWLSAPGVLVRGNVGEKINCFCSLIAARKGISRGGNRTRSFPELTGPKSLARRAPKKR